ncbi:MULTISPECIES: ABC transporter ATP-binding protein [unclassified Marinimicrobium]|jgi:putative ABC transport system ATP-binding protein|uniref:ABC transporter ATP-binding protein n=1 Tax=unclassified Marinimicrobium TaxID=2632100 RepID=UPI00257B7F63|nr:MULTISPECIES: ABC transporter ATP-binding protein [unclassified Marinimicrobium]|tara:strand:- start:333 stop:1070 length:738 start_codon:yes stop_codon:yes gene_type:complete
MDTDHKNTPMTPAIALRDVQFAWPGQNTPVLDIPDFSLAPGERLFLYGPSGAGKTSLLNLLAGIVLPQRGEVTLLGQSMAALSGRQRDRFRARHIGVVFQQFNLIPYLTVLANVCLAAHFARRTPEDGTPATPSDVRNHARELLCALGLPPEIAEQPASTLSVGQQQRVAVARALITRPEILLADEPSSALDSDHRDAFMEVMLRQVADTGSTLIFVSHDRSLATAFDHQQDLRELSRVSIGEEL